jgi:hypothetical protein
VIMIIGVAVGVGVAEPVPLHGSFGSKSLEESPPTTGVRHGTTAANA